MHPSRRGYAGASGASRRRSWWVAIVVVAAISGMIGFGAILPGTSIAATPSHSGASAPLVPAAHPLQFPPDIFFFSATPSTLFAGNSTVLDVDAYSSGDVLNYQYFNLPGCFSSNTSSLSCDAIFPGTYSVIVDVTDTLTFESAEDSVTLTVLAGSPAAGTGEFFTVDPNAVSNLVSSDAACTSVASPPFYQNYCYPEAQDPTLLALPHGEIGLVTQMYTNLTSNTCSGAAKATVARVGFAISTNGGASFGNSVTLGNDTCSYLDAIEPSFAVVGSHVYGVFVEENSTTFAAGFANRSAVALGFVTSLNGGATFGPVRTIATGLPFARPEIAAQGTQVYIVYDKVANGSHPIGGNVFAISVDELFSGNSGATFAGPFRAPGLNAAEGYNAMSPAVAVNHTGVLAIAYATNRTCMSPGPLGSCNEYGDSVVVVTSTTHGGNWQGPYVVARGAGESNCYSGSCLPGFFESTPQIALSYAPTGDDLYVAYAAVYSQGAGVGLTPASPTGVFAAESANGGVTWSTHKIAAPVGTSLVRSFNPGLGVSSGGVDVTYLQANATSGLYGFANSLSQWWDSAPLAPTLSFAPANAIDIDSFVDSNGAVNATRSSYVGDASSISFNTTTGAPLVAFAVPQAPTTTVAHGPGYYYINTTYATDLVVGIPTVVGSPGAVSILFLQTGLPTGLPWEFTLNGLSYTLTAPAILFNNLPNGAPIIEGASYQPGYWTLITTYFNATVQQFFFNQTVTFAFQVWVGLEFNQFPGGLGPWIAEFEGEEDVVPELFTSPFPAFVNAEWSQLGLFNFFNFTVTPTSEIQYFSDAGNYFTQCANTQCAYPSPWYFPLGSTLELEFPELAFNQLAPIYFSGQGNGNYTGPVLGSFCLFEFDCQLNSGLITMNGPMNETVWLGDSPENLAANVTISASGLPSTSQYSVSLDSVPYTSGATSTVTVDDVAAGEHTLSDISATSTTPGWEYFGAPAGPNPFVTPVETSIQLNFTSYVDVAAPPGTVTFYAPALATGTSWSIDLNGTTYSATTPWINVTARNGTYLWSAGDAVNPGGSTGYVPTTPAGNLSVLTGQTITVGYASAYQVVVESAAGGLVSVNGAPATNEKTVWTAGGSTVRLQAETSTGYTFGGWSGSGAGAYTGSDPTPTLTVGGPVVESASFDPLPGARFNLTFVADGLPQGVWWTVNLNGVGYSSNTSSLTVGNLWPWSAAGSAGEYSLGVPVVYQSSTNLTRFVWPGHLPVIGTNGSFTPSVVLDFDPEVYVQASGSSGGAVELVFQGAPAGASDWIPLGAGISLVAAANPGYSFSGWVGTGAGAYTGPIANVAFNASGPVSEVATFTPNSSPTLLRYSVTFDLTTTVEPGTEWSVTFGGQGYSAMGSRLTISGLSLGTYGLQLNSATSPSGLVQYRATATDPVAFTVKGNATIDVAYSEYYWVSVSASVGGTVNPAPGWYAGGSVLYLVASPNATYSFGGWTGSGPGNYSGSNTTAALFVSGPLTEVAAFSPNAGATTATTIWQNPDTWIGLGAVGLIAGIGVGVIGARWWARPAAKTRGATTPPSAGTSSRGEP
jgi:hypothetical protein